MLIELLPLESVLISLKGNDYTFKGKYSDMEICASILSGELQAFHLRLAVIFKGF